MKFSIDYLHCLLKCRISTNTPQSFVFTHLLFSFTPLLIFTVFVASTLLFALGSALLFSLFWLGVALLVLVPALILTSTVAFLVYAWGLSSYIFVRQVSGWIPGMEGKGWGREERRDVNGGGAESPALDGPSYAEVADPKNPAGGDNENADGHL